MFINDAMKELWSSSYKEYSKELNEASNTDVNELMVKCKNDIDSLSEQEFTSDFHTLTIFETAGCHHQFRENYISGCSFCDWDSNRVKELARLRKLKEKSKEKYAEIIKYSFQTIRGHECSPTPIEQLSIHDIMDDNQFPQEAFECLFVKDKIYITKPNVGIISSRAKNVTDKKVNMWVKQFKNSLTIGIGVEVGNDWIRNHWLNKNTTNEDIKKSIQTIHKNSGKVCGNILLGIPGMNHESSLRVFRDTCKYLLDNEIDYILVSPLIEKNNTMMSILKIDYKRIIYLFVESIFIIATEFKNEINKFTFSPDNFESLMDIVDVESKNIIQSISQTLSNFGNVFTTNSMGSFLELYEELNNSKYYTNIKNEIDKNVSIKQDLINSAAIITNELFNNKQEKFNDFIVELENFNENEIGLVSGSIIDEY